MIVRFFLAIFMGTVIASYLTRSKYSEEERDKPEKVWDILNFKSALVQKVKTLKEIIKEKQVLENELRASRDDLAQAKAQDEAILKGVAEGLVVVGSDGKFLFFNDQAKEILGLGMQDVPFSDWPKTYGMHYMDKDMIMDIKDFGALKALKGNSVMGEKIRIKNKNVKSFKIVEINASPVNTKTNTTGIVFTFTDITKEEELERAKDDFLSIASHQLRTPLGAMRWNLEMLLGGDFGKIAENVKDTIQDVYKNNQRMLDLVNGLLDVSRIEQQRVSDKPENVDIVKLIRSVVSETKPLADKQSVSVSVENKLGKNILLKMDKTRIHEVVSNLLSNAIKYNKRNGTVKIRVAKNEDGVQIIVEDTGIGIPEKDRYRMFSRFYRATNAMESETEGSGLGLFVVKSYVESWGGSVNFESEMGKGTKFIIELPLNPKSNTLNKNLRDNPHTITK